MTDHQKNELVDLLVKLYEYMEDRADVCSDSEGDTPNKEMCLMDEIDNTLSVLGFQI